MSIFSGFDTPEANYSKMPNAIIEAFPLIETRAELMVILYVLRHTWGFSEYGRPKRITLDEFCHGRKRRDGTRLDSGTGLAVNSVKDGVHRAVKHGFLIQELDDRDAGRRSHVYRLRMSVEWTMSGIDSHNCSSWAGRVSETGNRSEKDTHRKILQKDDGEEEVLAHLTPLLASVGFNLRGRAARRDVLDAYGEDPERIDAEVQALAEIVRLQPGRIANPVGFLRSILRGEASALAVLPGIELGFNPADPADQLLHEKLEFESVAAGLPGGPRGFKTVQQRDKWHKVSRAIVDVGGIEELGAAIDYAMVQGRAGLIGVINTVSVWADRLVDDQSSQADPDEDDEPIDMRRLEPIPDEEIPFL